MLYYTACIHTDNSSYS
uniref:Uncharacterized protein n=1 Tax=Arundo donax TaxID=35708 RepID=A0A0A8Z4Y9_ARUDO